MSMVKSVVTMVAVSVLLGGCMEGSIIQLKYNRKRDQCRTIAELRADTLGSHPLEPQRVPINPDIFSYAQTLPRSSQAADSVPKPLSPKEKSAQLGNAYNDCMGEQGWNIAPPKEKGSGKGSGQ